MEIQNHPLAVFFGKQQGVDAHATAVQDDFFKRYRKRETVVLGQLFRVKDQLLLIEVHNGEEDAGGDPNREQNLWEHLRHHVGLPCQDTTIHKLELSTDPVFRLGNGPVPGLYLGLEVAGLVCFS